MSHAAYVKKVQVSINGTSGWLDLPTTSPTINVGGEVLDDTNLKNNAGYRTRILGLHDWSINCDSNWASADPALIAVRDAKLNRTVLYARYLPAGSATASLPSGLGGQVVVESFNLSGDVGSLETVSITLQGTGAVAAAA